MAGGMSSTTGQGTKIPHALQRSQKGKNKSSHTPKSKVGFKKGNNSAAYEKHHTLWLSGIHSWNARMIQYKKMINVICHINKMKGRDHIITSVDIESASDCWRGCRQKGPLLHWCEYKLVKSCRVEVLWKFLRKLNIEPSSDPVIPLLGIYPGKTVTQNDTCTPVFIAVLFTIAKTWKEPKCPSTDEWIRKMWYMYTMEYYSAMKRIK